VIRFWIFDFGFWIRRTKSTKSLCFGLAALLFALSLPAEAQQQKKLHRIGLLTTGFPDSLPHLINAFKQGLRDHGYVEGQNVLLELRYAEAQAERLPILAGELVGLKVDVIVAIPNPAIDALKQATQTIPIVMPIGSDPVGVGFVASLARPGGNITGLSAYSPELNGKRLEIFKETIPELAARSLQLRTQSFNVGSSSDLAGVFKSMIKERCDAFIVFPGQPTLFANRQQVVALAAKNRLPAIYPLADYVDAGGLISYGVNNRDMFRRAATYVDRILKGAKPAELPVEQPAKFELAINLKTAKQIGMTIPPQVLARADKVIK
jgi:putative ABC transport system substrate-binding protein